MHPRHSNRATKDLSWSGVCRNFWNIGSSNSCLYLGQRKPDTLTCLHSEILCFWLLRVQLRTFGLERDARIISVSGALGPGLQHLPASPQHRRGSTGSWPGKCRSGLLTLQQSRWTWYIWKALESVCTFIHVATRGNFQNVQPLLHVSKTRAMSSRYGTRRSRAFAVCGLC